MTKSSNASAEELKKFADQANNWWDPKGAFKVLHEINPVRLQFIKQFISLEDKAILDIGCGGGILCEGLAKEKAIVTGIDLAEEVLAVANSHKHKDGLSISYQAVSAEDFAEENPQAFDVVCCLEMLEHVPDPKSIVEAASQLVKPGGYVFFSTINRTLKAYLVAVLGAEYVLNLLPRGTHDYEKFIRPSELCGFARESGLEMKKMAGLDYKPLCPPKLIESVDIYYILCCQKNSSL